MINPLTSKTKKDIPFTWHEKDKELTNRIIDRIREQTQLSYVNFERPFDLYTDASDVAIGATLTQGESIIGLNSKTLTKTQSNYTTTEKELFAIIKSLKHFWTTVFNSKVNAFTDHQNLTHPNTITSNRFQRWMLLLGEYDVDIHYIR